MHEMSLAEGILQIVEETARSHQAIRVRSVVLELGALSHVEEQALRFCFDAVTRGTVADGARLDVDADRRARLVHAMRNERAAGAPG